MHKWWARRLGSVFRSILLYSLADKNTTDWNQNPDDLWRLYSQDTDFSGKIVLDPMMGGGTTVVEALRFRCNVVAGDLNPVAWFIVKKQIENINPEVIKQALVELEKELGKELRRYYNTTCPECGAEAEAIYYFYCKELECPDCNEIVSLMRNFFLAKSPNRSGDYVICPSCWEVFETKSAKIQTECPKCQERFVAYDVTKIKNRRYICSTESCEGGRIIDSISGTSRLKERMYAIEFHCMNCESSRNPRLKMGRGYKKAEMHDKKLLELATEEFDLIESELPIPSTEIPVGVETKRAQNHGYVRFRDMFNSRQLLNLGKIYRWILGLQDWNLREFLILAFSNSLKYNNMFAKYNSTRGFITDIFRTHSFSPSMAPVEANCYDTAKGRGSFTAFVKLVIEGKEYCQSPFERVEIDDEIQKVHHETRISAKLVKKFQRIGGTQTVFLQCGSSENLRIPEKFVDVAITDPPYYDNVMYSELSNFFYVWLRLGLNEQYPYFQDELVPWEDEVIENRIQEKQKSDFSEGLKRIFQETNRVLKDDGLLVFTFHHKKLDAWDALLRAVLNAGFYVTAIYPIRSEMRASTHLHDMNNIVYDVILVCRKRTKESEFVTWKTIRDRIYRTTIEIIDELMSNEERPSILDVYMIGLGKCIEHYSKHYPNVVENGRRVEVEDVLKSIQEILEPRMRNFDFR